MTSRLTLNLPTTTIVAQPFNIIKWQLKFNPVAKGLMVLSSTNFGDSCPCILVDKYESEDSNLVRYDAVVSGSRRFER